MAHSYIALIDESGDDGLEKFRQPGAHGGASKWLILSACLFRFTHGLEAVRWRDEISALMPEKKRRDIHFADMNHNQRIAAVQVLAKKPIRAINIIANKEVVPPDIYVEKNQLYFYLTRYLIERVSWFCRDFRKDVPEGDGRVQITFSRRGGLSYEDFKDYMRKLMASSDDDISIHWPVIDIDAIKAEDHSRSASLQIADVIASAAASAFEPDRYGNTERRYLEELKRCIYCRNKNYLSYGMKFYPKHTELPLMRDQLAAANLFESGRPPGP